MGKIMLLMFCFGCNPVSSQEKLFGYSIHTFESDGDKIEYYIYNPNDVDRVFMYFQGTSKDIKSDAFYWYSNDLECCYGGILSKKHVKEIAKTHAVIFIAKPYIPAKINIDDFIKPKESKDRDYTYYRVWQANQVIAHLKNKKTIQKVNSISVFGTSEGAVVAGRLASENSDVDHLGMASVGFYNGVVFETIAGLRRKIQRREISDLNGQMQIDSILLVYDDILSYPKSKEKMWLEESYLWHSNQLETSVENFLKIDVPIYVSVGTKDEKTPIETTDILRMEFLKNGKSNLFFKPCINCDHNLEVIDANGSKESKLIATIMDFLRFTEQHN